MPTSFDGDNLIITLDVVVDGVLTVDVIDDLYEPWKEWVKTGDNAKYIPAFFPDGGNPLVVGSIDQGRYTFMNNVEGWRIRPAENDGTYTFIGQLVPKDSAIPILIPTIGTYRVLINGLQPITQSVAPLDEKLSHIQQFVWIDTSLAALGDGSQETPFNDTPTAIDYAEAKNIRHIHLLSDILLDRDLKNLTVVGVGLPTVDTSSRILTGAKFFQCQMEGMSTGSVIVQQGVLLPTFEFAGFVEKCAIVGDITINGAAHLIECYSNKSGGGYANITTGSNVLQVSDWHRSLGIKGMTGGTHTIEMYGGQLHLDATCVGGTIHLRGNYSLPPDDQSAGTVIIDETENAETWAHDVRGHTTVNTAGGQLNLSRKILKNYTETDPVTGIMTVFDDDKVTVLFTANIWENIAQTTPYAGNAVNSREALE